MTFSSFARHPSRGLGPLILATVLAPISGNTACRESSPVQRERPSSQGTARDGGPGDSLARLQRQLLTDSNPRAIAQAIVCENVRLGRLYGAIKADVIAREVQETIYRSSDEAAVRRVEAAVGKNAFDLSCGYPPGPNPPPITSDSGR